MFGIDWDYLAILAAWQLVFVFTQRYFRQVRSFLGMLLAYGCCAFPAVVTMFYVNTHHAESLDLRWISPLLMGTAFALFLPATKKENLI